MRPEVKVLRKNVYDFITQEIFASECRGPVLEIGPMQEHWTPVKKYFVNTREYFNSKGITYMACDHDPTAGVEITSSVLELGEKVPQGSVGTIIALEVIEHVSRIWELPALFAGLLQPGGKLFVSTPFYFFRHSPFPDYWRISEDGLKLLFEEHFEVLITPLLGRDERKPIHYTMTAHKK
jgi:hypothetical protein